LSYLKILLCCSRRSDTNPCELGDIYQNRKHNEKKSQFKEIVEKAHHPEPTAGASSNDMLRNSPSPEILDWGEEVEQSERLEAEGMLSDVMTRSSSLASLQEKSQTHPPRERRRRHRR
jgi:Mg2+/Co2+ transporter CorC